MEDLMCNVQTFASRHNLQLTIVAPPFVLDFAGARLDVPPDFPDEVWEP